MSIERDLRPNCPSKAALHAVLRQAGLDEASTVARIARAIHAEGAVSIALEREHEGHVPEALER